MDQELPAPADRTRLGLILSAWRDWAAPVSSEPVVERKLGGVSNDNYLVRAGKRRFVVRLNNDRFELGVDREVEYRILADIADLPFAPTLVFTTGHGHVTEFIEGRHPRAPDLTAMGRLFRQVHGIANAQATPLDPWVHLASYMRRISRPPDAVQACFEALMSRRSQPPLQICLCHNDLLMANVLDTGSGLVALDWEYARPGDPAFDIAVFAHTYALGDTDIARLLSAYHRDDATIRQRIEQYRDVYALIEICWWLIRGRDIASLSSQVYRLAQKLGLG